MCADEVRFLSALGSSLNWAAEKASRMTTSAVQARRAAHVPVPTRGSRSRGSHRHDLGSPTSSYAHSSGADDTIKWFSDPGGRRKVE